MADWELSDGKTTIASRSEDDLIRALRSGAVPVTMLCRVVGTDNWRGLRAHAPFARAIEEAGSGSSAPQTGAPAPASATAVFASLDRPRVTLITLAAIGALGTFLPWVNVPLIGWISGTDRGDGWFSLLLFLGSIAVVLFVGRAQPFSRRVGALASIPAFLAALLAIEKIVRIETMVSSYGSLGVFGKALGKALTGNIGPGAGLYVIAAAGLAVPVCGALLARRRSSAP